MTEQKNGYSGSYDKDIKKTYDKLANRESFSYDFKADPVYSAYKDDYQRQGRLAMKDSMAQAADLTGGYGSSYAQSVGQQQYGSYLEKLNNLMPELYSSAYERYQAENDRLSAQLGAAGSLADREYQRYSDAQDRSYKQSQMAFQQQQEAYGNLAGIISGTGYMPSDQELALSGMSRAQANALAYEFLRANNLLNSQTWTPPDAEIISRYNRLMPFNPAAEGDEIKEKTLEALRRRFNGTY